MTLHLVHNFLDLHWANTSEPLVANKWAFYKEFHWENGIRISPPGRFVAVNSHRYTEQDDEVVHPWEGYFCAFSWLCDIAENPQKAATNP